MQHKRPVAYVSPALTRALDYLDTAWRLRFKPGQPLVVSPGAISMGALERECDTMQDFNDRLIALGDVLGVLQVPDCVFDPVNLPKDRRGSLNRIQGALGEHVPNRGSKP
jgi:hypothetical protein